MTLARLALPPSILDQVDGAAVFRALQDTKDDDRELLTNLLSHHAPSDCPKLLDLCSGIGRVAEIALSAGWSVVAVDIDGGALELARRRYDHLTTIQWDLTQPLTGLGSFDAVICAHNAINEVGQLAPIFATAASALAPAGWFYCELVTKSPYPREYLVESLMIGEDDHGSWTIDTSVVPIERCVHDLHLLAMRYDNEGRLLRRIHQPLRRRVFPAKEILAAASDTGLAADAPCCDDGRFVFRPSAATPTRVGNR